MKAKKSARKSRGAAKRAPKDLTARTSVVGGTTTLTNIANLKHESLKGIAQNLRG
jgi:hypothetical protein